MREKKEVGTKKSSNKQTRGYREAYRGKKKKVMDPSEIGAGDVSPTTKTEKCNLGTGYNPTHIRNDASWYALDAQYLKNAYSLNFSAPSCVDIFNKAPALKMGTPGVAVVKIVNTFGLSLDDNSPVNVMARKFFAEVRKFNTGSVPYEAPDLMMVVYAAIDIVIRMSLIKRAIGVLGRFSPYNKTLGVGLISAMGFQYDDLATNSANIRSRYNILVDKFNSALRIPNFLTYADRKAFLFSNIFMDKPSIRSGFYITRPYTCYDWNTTSLPTGTCLRQTTINWGDNNETAMTWLDNIESALNLMIVDQDVNIMMGDIIKAYGEGSMLQLGYLEDGYQTPIVYSEEFGVQIHNANITGRVHFFRNGGGEVQEDGYQLDATPLYQENGSIRSLLMTTSESNARLANQTRYLDVESDLPDPAEVAEATRFMCTIDTSVTTKTTAGTAYTWFALNCGTEVVHSVTVWTGDENGDLEVNTPYWEYLVDSNFNPVGSGTTGNIGINGLSAISKLGHHPLIPICQAGTADTVYGYIGDLHNFVPIAKSTIEHMNYAAIYALMVSRGVLS
nr:putative capsid [Marmot picobirnavirus]